MSRGTCLPTKWRRRGGATGDWCLLNGKNPTEAEAWEHVCAGSAQKRASLPRTTCSEPEAAAYSHLSPRHVSFTQYKREKPHFPNKRTGWPPAGAAGLCELPTSGEPPVTTALEPSQSSSLSDGSCPTPAVCDTRRDRLNWVVSRP
jgi:hypothetical protein